MSDRPTNNPNEPQYTGGWRRPNSGATWRPTQKPAPSESGWQVIRKLPSNLDSEPETTGGWHLPRPEDTTVEPEDEMRIAPERIEAAESFRPEDMVLLEMETSEATAQTAPAEEPLSAAVGLVDTEEPPKPATARPSESVSGTLLDFEKDEPEVTADSSELMSLEGDKPATLEVAEDDSTAFSMSELIALQSLVEQAPPSAIVPTAPAVQEGTAESGTGGQPAAATGQTGAQTPVQTDSAADYARQQLELLKSGNTGASAPVSTGQTGAFAPISTGQTGAQIPAASEPQAESYAQQQLRELGLTGSSAPVAAATSASQPLTPAQEDLARKYRETEDRVRNLRTNYRNNQISRDQLQDELKKLMILDDQGNWWMMGVETDTWYRFDGTDWQVATPPVLASTMSPSQPGRIGAPPTATSTFDPNEVIGGSLPYFPTGGAPAQQEYTQPSVGYNTYGSDTGGYSSTEAMDLPRADTPVQDPDRTMVGAGGAYLNPYRPEAAPTVQGLPRVQDTVYNPAVADPYADNPAIASPIQAEVVNPPSYDLDENSPEFEAIAQQERARTVSTVVRFGLVAIAGIVLLIAIGLVLVVYVPYNNIATQYEAQVAALKNYQPGFQTARILDVNGNLIASLTSDQGGARTDVALDKVSPFMIHAIVSLENERFFEDPGWDWVAIGRAILQNTASGGVTSGASTITQQIAEQLVLKQPTNTPDLKLREIIIAAEIAKNYTKEEILRLYLNEIYFGNQSYGVEAAAQFYFGVSANDLNLPQAAMLAGMVASPIQYNPVRGIDEDLATYGQRRDGAFARMDYVIQRMQQVGCLPIPGQPAGGFCVDANVVRQAAIQTGQVKAKTYSPREFTVKYPHFVQFVQRQIDNIFGPSAMFQQGFVIKTTLNPTVQDAAETALDATMSALIATNVNTGSVMVTDPRNGAIRAMVGSPDFSNEQIAGQVNGALTWQQPGSSIKPIVYTGALEGADTNGDGVLEYLTPASILWDVPTTFTNTNPPYSPTNFDRAFHGPVAVRYALQNSYNIPAIKTYQFIGEAKFKDVAARMGLAFPEGATFGLPTGIGATEVSLYGMMQAYGTLANGGVRMPLYAIESITDAAGNPITGLPERPSVQAVQPQIAYIMSSILSDDPARGSAFPTNGWLTIPGLATQNVVAAKTGTTDGARDLWTMGYTRNAVVGVWLGRPDDQTTLVNDGGYGSAAPLWNRVMQTVLSTMPRPDAFANPGGVNVLQICTITGALPASNCGTNLRNELFLQSNPPPSADQSFVRNVAVDTWTGLLGNQYCPDNQLQGTVINIPDASAINFLNSAAGAPFARQLGITSETITNPPTQACDLNTEVPIVRIISPVEGQQVSSQVQITGAATAASFNRFELAYAPASNPTAFTPITGAVVTPQTSGLLGTWNTAGVPNGQYILRLQMFSNNSYGGNATRQVTVVVNNVVVVPTTAPLIPTSPGVIIPTIDPFGAPTQTPIPFEEQNP